MSALSGKKSPPEASIKYSVSVVSSDRSAVLFDVYFTWLPGRGVFQVKTVNAINGAWRLDEHWKPEHSMLDALKFAAKDAY